MTSTQYPSVEQLGDTAFLRHNASIDEINNREDDDMKPIIVSETINAPIERVFQIASNIPQAAENIEGITAIETLKEAQPAPDNNGIVGLGYAWRETRIMFGKKATEDMSITQWTPPNAYRVEARSHGTHYLTDITFDQTDEHTTRITMSFNATPESFMAKVMMKVFAAMTKHLVKCLQADLADIKAKAESMN
ncbi:MAG: SRPBCC family protein [Phycisphaerales bacterium JB047]